MDIIGQVGSEEAGAVHTIDVWYVAAERVWMVERLDAAGHPIGPPHRARTRTDALHCLAHWRRAHAEAHLATPLAAVRQGRPKLPR